MAVETNQYKNNRNLTLAESLLDHHEITVLLFPQRVWWGWLKGGVAVGEGRGATKTAVLHWLVIQTIKAKTDL